MAKFYFFFFLNTIELFTSQQNRLCFKREHAFCFVCAIIKVLTLVLFHNNLLLLEKTRITSIFTASICPYIACVINSGGMLSTWLHDVPKYFWLDLVILSCEMIAFQHIISIIR